jgi:hypothetical protein
MNDDILAKAEAMMIRPNGYAPSLITHITGELVAEIKRLREEMRRLLRAITEHEDNATISHQQLAAKDLHITSLETMAQATAESHLQFVNAHFEQEKKWEEESKTKDAEISSWVSRHAYATELVAKGDALYRETCAKKDAEIRKWQEIAKEERTNLLMLKEAQAGTNLLTQKIAIVANKGKYREQAAKELSIPHDSYLSRLEKEFLDIYSYAAIGWSQHGYPIEFPEGDVEEAQEVLEKIRHDK